MTNKPYTIGLKANAFNSLVRLDKGTAESILRKLLWLARNIGSLQHEALTGQWKGCYRYRVGHYRVIYQIEHDEQLIVIVDLGHRRDVYGE